MEKQFVFTDNFTFRLVMQNPEICKGVLERILPDVDFGEIKYGDAEGDTKIEELKQMLLSIETEKVLDFDPYAHGVRFDAYVKGTENWAEIEMQTYIGEHIGKRSRYYQSNMDMDAFSKGKKYKDLTPTYVIFICTFDYMKDGKPVYYFQHYDVKNGLPLDDEAYIIVLNTKCNPDLVPDRLKPLFAYINDPERVEDEFVEQIEAEVLKYNSTEWRRVQVTLKELMDRQKDEGYAEGHAEGRAEGETTMQERINKLNDKLFELGRSEDVRKASKDSEFQKKLFEEFGL